MEKKHNPNSHESLRQDQSNSWSELPLDLLNSVFERLGFADFQRGKSVCSSWYSASRQAVPKNQIPWLILFPEQNNENCCTLFNPEEKDKLYKTQDLGLEFAKCVCVTTYGSWLLMRDPPFNLYIVNLFTQERIDLPPMESQLGTTKVERTVDDRFHYSNDREQRTSDGISIRSPVFWIDEKTKDYVVIWGLGRWCVVFSKKGDNLWNQIPKTSDCIALFYKDHKLYFLSYFGSFKIFDFSGEIPRETLHGGVIVNGFERGLRRRQPSNSWRVFATKLVVTVTGDVLKVEKMVRLIYKTWSLIWSFRVYKVYSSQLFKKYEEVKFLGDEAMFFYLGITVLVNGLEGVKRNSIYFNRSHENNPNDEILLFNLETQEMEKIHEFDGSSFQLSTARLFLPS